MLVGRDAEIVAVVEAMSAGGAGVVVTGEAGVGKTALLSTALDRLGRPVRQGQCFGSLSWTAGLPLQQATGRPVPAGDPAWTAQWLAQLCAGGVLRLDDVHWADPLTLAVLELLPPSVPVAATVRAGDPGAAAALAALATIGVVPLALAPLGMDDAGELARRRHPRLTAAEADALARRCGGNPLLIGEIGDDGASAGLRRSVVGRVRRLGDDAWTGFALLTLADEPLPREALPDADVLVAAGLATIDDGSDGSDGAVVPRHPLLAEVMDAELTERADDRRRIAALLGRWAAAAGRAPLAARALAAAGERGRAVDAALRAVEGSEHPGERAGLLRLAAQCADPPRSHELAVRAVEELVQVGDYAQAATLIEQLPEQGHPAWFGLVGRVRWQQGDDDAALAAFEAGLAVAQPATRDRIVLLCEHARAVLLGVGDAERGLLLARAALEEAHAVGTEQARALSVLGSAEYFNGIDTAVDRLAHALRSAEDSGDLLVEFTSANNLVVVHESRGDGALACAVAERFAERAGRLRLRGWQLQMQAAGLNARMHLGDYEPILAAIPALLAGAVDRRTRDQLEVTLSIALVDVGRGQAASERLTGALAASVQDPLGRGNLLWVLSEARFWTGDHVEALADAQAAYDAIPDGAMRLFPTLTIAHARAALGLPVEAPAGRASYLPVLAAAPVELAALAALSQGDARGAAALFADAASAWAGRHRRGELRCRWLAAEHADDADRARVELLRLEAELDDQGWRPLLGQVRRSLRRRGVRRSAPRGHTGELTAREQEVLELVGDGLSTDEIAARLSVSSATVAAQIASARARLGASTRWQAAGRG